MQIVDVNAVSCNVEAEVIAFTDSDAGFGAAAGQPHCECVRVMVAAVVSALDHGSPPELAAPNHQGVFKHTSLLQVLNECGGRPISVLAVLWLIAFIRDQPSPSFPGGSFAGIVAFSVAVTILTYFAIMVYSLFLRKK